MKLLLLLSAVTVAMSAPAHALHQITSYRYDAAGRLSSANYGGASSTSYAYDQSGNLLSLVSTTNIFIPLAGSYAGLVTSVTPTALNTGLITLTVSTGGAFTGLLKLGGVTYRLMGAFDMTTGAATLMIPRGASLSPLTLNLQLSLDSAGVLTGTITAGETATLVAGLTPFGKKAPPPTGLIGPYTALFKPTETDPTVPFGDGFATVNVLATGAITLVGTLADGTKASVGTLLAADGSCPLFLALYKNAGFIAGTVDFSTDPGVMDFVGSLAWRKPATAPPIYPAAFNTTVNLLGSRYAKPAAGQRVLDFADSTSNAQVTTSGGNSGALSKFVTLDVRNKIAIVAPAPDKLKLSVATASGLLSGSFVDSGKTRQLRGILFQQGNRGSGFFLGNSESGIFSLAEPP